MAKERDVIYESSKSSTSSEDNDATADREDLRVLAVIESNDAETRSIASEKCKVTRPPKMHGSETNKIVLGIDERELIVLDDEPTILRARNDEINAVNSTIAKFHDNPPPRVIELSDDKSKMELRREFKVDAAAKPVKTNVVARSSRKMNIDGDDDDDDDNEDDDDEDEDDGSADILSRLPPGTILIKQSVGNLCSGSAGVVAAATPRTASREDSDYVHDSSKESTGTNSSGSGSTVVSYNATGKVRRMQYRSVRSKKVVEVRRNPVRNKKKKPIDEDFARPRQRLLSAKRRSSSSIENPGRKRARNAPTPYMNTRSVTRKMYTVGATYQAPSVNDALEWKEWPCHGMHERPIWHPQIGLAYEYNERTFVSCSRSYREIIQDPVIEVVSVNPHPERLTVFQQRNQLASVRNQERMRYCNAPRINANRESPGFPQRGNSFRTCMHGSFHSVLAYCARVVTPSYERNVDAKIRAVPSAEHRSQAESAIKPEVINGYARNTNETRTGPMHAVAGTSNKIPESLFPCTGSGRVGQAVPKCLVMPGKTIHFTNVRNIQGNILQEVFNRSSKNTLIFLKPTDPPGKTAEKIAAALKTWSPKQQQQRQQTSENRAETAAPPQQQQQQQRSNPMAKLDDGAISDETLMEMSSIYNNLVPGDDGECTGGRVTTKVPGKPCSGAETTPRVASFAGFRRANPTRCGSMMMMMNQAAGNNESARFTRSNGTMEIAKILAEYNEKAAAENSRSSVVVDNRRCANVATSNGRSNVSSAMIVERPAADSRGSNYGVNGVRFERVGKNCYENASPAGPAADWSSDNQAMDLSTGKSRDSVAEEKTERPKGNEAKKWLRELIEDTAILYCATGAGVDQSDVNEYMDTLDSVQKMQWLGS